MEKEKTIAQAKSSISQDILYEIFFRHPDKSFTRFKCVSKFCNSLVLFKIYTIKQKSIISDKSNLIRQLEERIDGKCSAHLIKELNSFPYHKIDYIEGLFCLWNSSQLPPIIFNPSTRKMHTILLMTYPHNYLMSSSRYWILEQVKSWREIKLTNLFVTSPLKGVCIDRVIYFFNFRIISLWNKHEHYSVEDMFDYIHLIEMKGKLNIYYLRNYVYSNTLNGEIVLMNSLIKPNWIFFYNFKKNSWREIEVLGFEEKINIFGICS
ncbi:hypothetical protein R3W88_013667 [Solanum pinnatisectum]|uniref:F-box domain-containing protein n=1 Tax=Solanum pinnatisectum TaxID=50273 RepID=A0AAV9KPJ3_9SOLN|nr:hypothetical protein R3W88_013667 [Solanum pinnatisectum]